MVFYDLKHVCYLFIIGLCFLDIRGRDEELLARGLELNDAVQSLLAKHDAICSGSPLTMQVNTSVSSKPSEASTVEKSNEVKSSSPASNICPPATVAIVKRNLIDEDEEEEEDFAQLTRRFHILITSIPSYRIGVIVSNMCSC